VYRKLHPAIHQSVYAAGSQTPVFRAEGLTFGIVICNDSNYAEPAKLMAAQGATALFVPTNNGLPAKSAHPELVGEARKVDIARALENRMWVIRADVAGHNGALMSYGCSGIVDPDGKIAHEAPLHTVEVLVAEIPADPAAMVP